MVVADGQRLRDPWVSTKFARSLGLWPVGSPSGWGPSWRDAHRAVVTMGMGWAADSRHRVVVLPAGRRVAGVHLGAGVGPNRAEVEGRPEATVLALKIGLDLEMQFS